MSSDIQNIIQGNYDNYFKELPFKKFYVKKKQSGRVCLIINLEYLGPFDDLDN